MSQKLQIFLIIFLWVCTQFFENMVSDLPKGKLTTLTTLTTILDKILVACLFHLLALFLLATSERKLHIITLSYVELKSSSQPGTKKVNSSGCDAVLLEKISCQTSGRKTFLLIFLNLSRLILRANINLGKIWKIN